MFDRWDGHEVSPEEFQGRVKQAQERGKGARASWKRAMKKEAEDS
jgi:hypothetical protein